MTLPTGNLWKLMRTTKAYRKETQGGKPGYGLLRLVHASNWERAENELKEESK